MMFDYKSKAFSCYMLSISIITPPTWVCRATKTMKTTTTTRSAKTICRHRHMRLSRPFHIPVWSTLEDVVYSSAVTCSSPSRRWIQSLVFMTHTQRVCGQVGWEQGFAVHDVDGNWSMRKADALNHSGGDMLRLNVGLSFISFPDRNNWNNVCSLSCSGTWMVK